MQLVNDDVFRGGERRLREAAPAGRHHCRVGEIDDLAALAVHGQAQRVRIRDQVVFYRIRRRYVNLDVVKVKLSAPVGSTGDTPGARGRVRRHRVGRGACPRAGVVEQLQADALCRRRPHRQRRLIAVEHRTEVAAVGIKVIQHARNLQAGRVHGIPVGIGNRECELPLQDRRHHGEIGGIQPERRETGEMRKPVRDFRRQACRVEGERQ